jgi:hypothetical protein
MLLRDASRTEDLSYLEPLNISSPISYSKRKYHETKFQVEQNDGGRGGWGIVTLISVPF